jgi:hypothetical protein
VKGYPGIFFSFCKREKEKISKCEKSVMGYGYLEDLWELNGMRGMILSHYSSSIL